MKRFYNEQLIGSGHVRRQTFDVLVTGGGLLGMITAAELAARRLRVAIIDKAEDAGLHVADQAPAMLDLIGVPNREVAGLMRLSEALYAELGVLHPQHVLHIFGHGHLGYLIDAHNFCHSLGIATEVYETDAVAENHPYIRLGEDHCAGALYGPETVSHIVDLRKVYEHYRSQFFVHGGHFFHGEELLRSAYGGDAWTIDTGGENLRARVIVNCAGAGAGDVAARCNLKTQGLEHRHYVHIEGAVVPHGPAPDSHAPIVVWHGHSPLRAHFAPSGHVHLSLPTEHHEDVGPDEARTDRSDLGHAAERMMHRTHLALVAPHRRHWTETRTFTADHKPLIGWESGGSSFFWAAGFGSHGPQCAPAVAKLVVDGIMGEKTFADRAEPYGVALEQFKPGRVQKVMVHSA